MAVNEDVDVVKGFGQQWSLYDQSVLNQEELQQNSERYFEIFPWSKLPANATGFDLGCGSGRYSRYVAQRVGHLHCIDASGAALLVAKKNLKDLPNCSFHHASVDQMPIDDNSMDFGCSLGVFHYVPYPQSGIRDCVKKLKPGAPFLMYVYYALDNRPWWFRAIWRVSDLCRRIISCLPFIVKEPVCKSIAIFVYFPLARLALLLEKLGANVHNFPLATYRNLSFYTMSTDALDRFGTKLEHRFTREQVTQMMSNAGLERIIFSEKVFWAACGFKKNL